VLLSTLVWTNRGSDDFGIYYGGNAATARTIVDRALADWGRVIQNFNYAGGGNTFSLNISAAVFSDSTLGLTDNISTDSQGKPTSARIRMDDNGAGGNGWYFDPTPGTATVPDDGEYTSMVNPFFATRSGPGVVALDFYNVIAHEIGHAVGIARGSGLAINNYLTNTGVKDPANGTSDLYAFNVGGGPNEATITSRGGGHFYEGPAIFGHPELPTHPGELMNPQVGDGERHLISDLDATTLTQAYGYTITMPSQINTFYANLDVTNNSATVQGTTGDDTIVVNVSGSNVQAWVAGICENLPAGNVHSISVIGQAGNDTLWVNSLPVNTSVEIDPGSGADTTRLGYGDLDANLLYAMVNVSSDYEIATHDVLYVDDYLDTGGDSYIITNATFTKTDFGMLSYAVDALIVNAGMDQNSISIQSTAPSCPVTVNGSGGHDDITVGSSGSGVEWIQGTLTLQNDNSYNNIIISDTADFTADTVTVDDVVTDAWYGRVTGLGPAAILWKTIDTQNVEIDTGMGADTVRVFSTVKPTTISSGGGGDTVRVGVNGTLASILADVTVCNPPSYTTLIIDNAYGIWQQTITMDTVNVSGEPYGRINGMAVGDIYYKDYDTASVRVLTGAYEDVVNISATGVPTTIENGGSVDSVNVGVLGRGAQDVLAQLTIEDIYSSTYVTMDDNGDGAARNVSVDSSGSYMCVTGLAPAMICINEGGIYGVTLRSGGYSDTVNVLRSSIPLTVTSCGGLDAVNVGNPTNGMQAISDSLLITNPPSYSTLTFDDSANNTLRTPVFDTTTLGDGVYGRITGLSPGLIEFKVADTDSPISIKGGSAADSFIFSTTPDGRSVVLDAGGGTDFILVNGTGTNAPLYVTGGEGADTFNINQTSTTGLVYVEPSGGDDEVNLVPRSGYARAVFTDTQRIGTLTIGRYGSAQLAPGSSHVLTMMGLSITASGKLDLADGAAILDYSGDSPINTVRSLLASGYAGGAWNGNGINSSVAASTPNHSLGLAEATDLFHSFPASFAGQSIDNTSVLIRYTVSGDANLDQQVDLWDLYNLAINWHHSGCRWSRGDFNCTQYVDAADLGILAYNWQHTLNGVLSPAAPLPGLVSQLAPGLTPTRTPVRTAVRVVPALKVTPAPDNTASLALDSTDSAAAASAKLNAALPAKNAGGATFVLLPARRQAWRLVSD
jgi:hypothetical protein